MNYILKRKWLAGTVGLILLIGAYLSFRGGSAQISYAVTTASKGTLIASVSGTGQVSGKSQVDLKPAGSGTVVSVKVLPGDTVKEGQTIVVLDRRTALAALTQAQASYESAQANYNKVVGGISEADLNVNKASLQASELSLSNAYQNAADKLISVYTDAEGAVRRQTDGLFRYPESSTPQLTVVSADANASDAAEKGRAAASLELIRWNNELQALGKSPAPTDVDAELQKSQAHLDVIKDFLNHTKDALLATVSSQNLTTVQSSGSTSNTQTTLDSYKQSVDQARSTVDQADASLVSAEQSIRNAQASLAQAQASYDQKVAPPQDSDVKSAKAQLLNAQSQLQTAQSNYDDTVITAPFDGQIASLSVQKGDQVTPTTAIGTVITHQKVAEISLNEADVANVHVGDKATLTFDAIPDLTIAGKMAEVDSVGTATQGVVSYAAKVSFDTQDDRVRSGMSVTANVITQTKQDVLIVPSSAIKSQGSTQYVEVVDQANLKQVPGSNLYTVSAQPRQVAVQTGLSNDSQTEITSGLNEGETVITQTMSSSAKTTGSQGSNFRGAGGFRIGG